jgi:hypothetical protein
MECKNLGSELHIIGGDNPHSIHHCNAFGRKCTLQDQGVLDKDGAIPVCSESCPKFAEKAVYPRGRFCYWSCDTTKNGAAILSTMIASARAAGVEEDFHVFANGDVPGATIHNPGKLDIARHVFKWRLLRGHLASLDYDFFVWLDSDNYFVRHPGDWSSLIRGNAVWAQLESEMTAENVRRAEWWGAPIAEFNQLLTDHGVTGDKRHNTNGGCWIVRKEAIETFVEQALSFHSICLSKGWNAHDETSLAWIGQVENMSGYGAWVAEKELNTNAATCDIWACDWNGFFKGRLPTGEPWTVEDYMTGEQRTGNPAIVHAMRSKDAMAAAGRKPALDPIWPLGDQVESVLSTVGITKERVSRWLGRPCNCPARQEKLNKLGNWAASFAKGIFGKADAETEINKLLA